MIERTDRRVVQPVCSSADRRLDVAAVAGLSAWAAVVVAGASLVAVLNAQGRSLALDAPPLRAVFDVGPTWWIPATFAVGIAMVAWAPRAAATLSWPALVAVAPAAAALWSVVLALARGTGRLTSGLRAPEEYLAVLPEVEGAFLQGFVANLAEYPAHVQGHPPGFVVLLHGLDRLGLGGAGVAAGLCIGAAALGVTAVLVAMRAVAGERSARRAAPFLVAAPAAIWTATSGDAFFLGASAWAVALVVVAVVRSGRRSDALAAAGGLLFGVTAFLSYGLVLLGVVPIVVARAHRRVRPIVVAGLGAVPVFVAFAAAGFWWPSGLLATRARYFDGIATQRPYLVFLLANLAAFGIALGPAIGPALGSLRERGVWLLAGGALLAVAIADLSGMSKAEVERIWLPFAPWVLVATTSLGRRVNVARTWLGVQIAFAMLVELVVRTGW